MPFFDHLMSKPLTELDLSRYVEVDPTATVSDAVETMAETGESCAFVIDDGHLQGVFTQRDVLNRIVGRPSTWDQPITDHMTTKPRTIGSDGSVAEGLAIMTDWWVRSIPVVESDGTVVGNLSYYTYMRLIARGIADDTSTGTMQLRHGFGLVDLSGLKMSTPVTMSRGDGSDVAVHQMRARAIGSVLVTDERENLEGIVTEWDLLAHLGCRVEDPSTVAVSDIMSGDPISVPVRSSIADAIEQMAGRGASHIPLLGESGRPVGVASFRDVAAYFEASLPALT